MSAHPEPWTLALRAHLEQLMRAVDGMKDHPLGTSEDARRAGERTQVWLASDPGPSPEVTESAERLAQLVVSLGTIAAEASARLIVVREQALAAMGDLGRAGRRHLG